MKNILVALDFSAVTDRLVETGAALAKVFGGNVWLMHVANPNPEEVGFEAAPVQESTPEVRMLRAENDVLQDRCKALREQGVEAYELFVQGEPVPAILKEADKLDADVIILGRHGRGALYRMLVGSVSKGVLQESKRPVLLIPGEEL